MSPEINEPYIHHTAVADEGCSIGNGTRVWHFSHIMTGAVVGEECTIGQNVMIAPEVTVGNGCKIQNNVSLYTGVVCEEKVFIGPSAVFTNVVNPRSGVDRRHEFKRTLVRRGATIGANATIMCGIEIGEYAFIGAGAVVLKDVPAYALIVGNPGTQKGWMSAYGEKLDFDGDGIAVCAGSGEKYRRVSGQVSPLKDMN